METGSQWTASSARQTVSTNVNVSALRGSSARCSSGDSVLSCAKFYSIHFKWRRWSQRLAKAHVPIEEYPQSVPNLTAATSNLFDLIQSRSIALYSDAAMRLAVSRAIAGAEMAMRDVGIDLTLGSGVAAAQAHFRKTIMAKEKEPTAQERFAQTHPEGVFHP